MRKYASVRRFLTATAVLVGAFIAGAHAASAQELTFNLTPNVLTGAPGETLTFTGILSNTGATTVFIDGLDVTFFDANSTDFLTILQSLDLPTSIAGNTEYSGAIFEAIIGPGAVGFPLGGTATILGGLTANSGGTVGIPQNFTVESDVIATVPEAGTGGLFALAGVGTFAVSTVLTRRRRATTATV